MERSLADLVAAFDSPQRPVTLAELGNAFPARFTDQAGESFRLAREGQSPRAPLSFAQRLSNAWENPPHGKPSIMGMIKGGYEGLKAFGDALDGNRPIVDQDGRIDRELIGHITDLASLVMLGGSGAPRGVLGSGPIRPGLGISGSKLAQPEGSRAASLMKDGIASDLEQLGGGIPSSRRTSKGATQFDFPNGTRLRFDINEGQFYPTQGPHINLENVPGSRRKNNHISVRP